MTAVIRIDPDDELPAILERLPPATPCVLVLPPHARALSSLVGAKLLARRAETVGTRLVVVSDEAPVIAHARAAGVSVAESVVAAERLLNPFLQNALPDASGALTRTHKSDGGASLSATSGNTQRAGSPAPVDSEHLDDHDAASLAIGEQVAAARAVALSGGGAASVVVRGHSNAGRPGRGGRNLSVRRGAATPVVRGATASPNKATQRGATTPSGAAAAGGGRPPRSGRSRLGAFGFLTPLVLTLVPLLLLLGVIYYLISGLINPSASVVLHVYTTTVNGETVVHAVSHLPASQGTTTTVGMAVVTQPEQATVDLPVRGRQTLPGRTASGTLSLANHSNVVLVVPSGTTFTTGASRVAFVTTQSITLAAATYTFGGSHYGVGSVPIRAAQGGGTGNVVAGAITGIPPWFSGQLEVRNDQPTTGGSDHVIQMVRPSDLSATVTTLFARLEGNAARDIRAAHGQDIDLHPLSIARSPVTPQIAGNGRSATLTLSILMRAVYVHRESLLTAARAALIVPQQQELLPSPGAVTWSAQWSGTSSAQTITLAVTGSVTTQLDVAALKDTLKGRSRADAQQYLKAHRLSADPIALSPSWSDHLPNDPHRIAITVAGQ